MNNDMQNAGPGLDERDAVSLAEATRPFDSTHRFKQPYRCDRAKSPSRNS